MERTDALVATAGGVILAVAVVASALAGTTGTVAFALDYSAQVNSERASDTFASAGTAEHVFRVGNNTTRAAVEVRLGSTTFPSGASLRVEVTSPSGTSFHDETQIAAGDSSGTVTIDIDLATMPQDTTVQAENEDAARARAVTDATNAGDWTVVVRYAPGPVAPPSATTSITFEWTSWRVDVAPPAPEGTR